MREACVLLFLAACGSRTSTAPTTQAPPPVEQGSAAPATPDETGRVCGTRGAAECPANMFCSYQPGADCGDADAPGHCAERTEMCAEIYKPVCGCDGKTYGNACTAAAAAMGVRAEGACK